MTITKSPYISNPDILFCHEARSTRPVALDFGEAEMLPAGTLISCEGKAVNDLTALGVLLYDAWKGYGSGQGVVLISGHVDLAKAQENSGLTYSSEAKAALKGICFVGDTEVPGGAASLPFGEITVMGDTLTWDGNTDGLEAIMGMLYRVSDVVPTLEDLQQGGNYAMCEQTPKEFNSDTIMNMEDLGMGVNLIVVGSVFIALEDGATMTQEGLEVVFDKAGVYFMWSEDTLFVSSFTINNYTGFEMVEVKTLEPKYLPKKFVIKVAKGGDGYYQANKTFDEITEAYTKGFQCVVVMGDAAFEYPLNTISSNDATFLGINGDNEEKVSMLLFVISPDIIKCYKAEFTMSRTA